MVAGPLSASASNIGLGFLVASSASAVSALRLVRALGREGLKK